MPLFLFSPARPGLILMISGLSEYLPHHGAVGGFSPVEANPVPRHIPQIPFVLF